MGHYFKWLGDRDQARALWENKEALDKYLARLKELMEEDELKEGKASIPGLDSNNSTKVVKNISKKL